MRHVSVATLAIVFALAPAQGLRAQVAQSTSVVPVPRLVSVTGVYQPADGQPPPAGTVVTLLIYAEEHGGTPLWQETQNVVLDKSGRYSLLLGAGQTDGIPLEVFTSGEAQWLALHFAGLGEVEGPRTRITSVPYALRSADADTLGGHPASAYQLAPTSTAADGHSATTGTSTAKDTAQSSATTDVILPGTPNFLAKYVNAADVGPSAVYDSGTGVGIGTTAPADVLHLRFTNTNGALTGLAVQNLGNTPTSYSGTLFYDQNGALSQFQGFNNVTHEYRINNIAQNGAAQFNGSINFMTGFTSRFLVTSVGNIGIGTTAPGALLDVSNALVPTTAIANIAATSYGANNFGSEMVGRKARGTAAAPSAVLNGDALSIWGGKGYGASGFSPISSGISVLAAENWTDTAQGTFMNFSTTPNGTSGPINRMTIGSNGNVGIGVFSTQANLEVSNANAATGAGMIFSTTFTNAGTSLFVGRRARGTGIAPTAVLNGDTLVGFVGRGRGATNFGGVFGAGMYVRAAENWTDTAQGAALSFDTTPIGATGDVPRMTIDPSGNVGIGTLTPQAPLEVSRTGTNAGVVSTLYANGADAGSFLVAQTARGTAAAPLAVHAGDFLGALLINGYGTTGFNEAAVVGAVAAENFTDTARGTAIGLGTTPLGGNDTVIGLALLPSGNVSIGTPADANGIPTATDKLQVFGDIRVGSSGTDGCVKRFDGLQLTGTCVSDRRFKKDIMPFGSVLNQLTGLQPVHYYWRAAEFPDRHFGEAQAYGLIAQDVERVFPELVVTGEDGFKAIDYSKLPLLTIQAIKELKAENDDLKAQNNNLKGQNDALKDRVTEIERLIKAMRPASQR